MPMTAAPRPGRFRYVDLFAGIGGLRAGFDAIGGECVLACESDRHAQATYLANHGGKERMADDVRSLRAGDIPPHEALLAGFPCQSFSLAGVSKANALGREHGFRDASRGTLFFEAARIIALCRPAAFVLENVSNLRTHDGGRTFQVIHDTLAADLGYHVEVHQLNARHWLPQNRPRLFLVGIRDAGWGWDRPLPLPGAPAPTLASVLHPEDGMEPSEPPYTEGRLASVSPAYTLGERTWRFLQAHAEAHRASGNGFGYGLCGPDDVARALTARYHKDGAEILVRRPSGRPRRLTPRECARLQGFDRPGRPPFRIPVSDTQAYRQFGNAVAPPVAVALCRDLNARFPQAFERTRRQGAAA